MIGVYIKESSIEDSYIYKSFNASNSVIEKLVKYIKTSVALDSSVFEEQYMQMKKASASPLSKNVIEAFDNSNIELLYSKDAKVGTTLPFIIRKNEKNKIVATIFIASFATVDKDNNLVIPVKQLYALLESAYIAWQIQVNPTKVQRNVAIMKICSSVYVQMIMRILNKEYALTLDKVLYDKVTYVVTRFFITNIWQYPSADLIESYSSNELKNIGEFDLDMLRMSYTNNQIKDINDLLSFLSTLSPRMAELNTRYFIERFINTYHGSSILSIDYLPYVFFVIVNVILGSFLVSQTALNDIIKTSKNINKFYPELAKLM